MLEENSYPMSPAPSFRFEPLAGPHFQPGRRTESDLRGLDRFVPYALIRADAVDGPDGDVCACVYVL